MIENCGSTLTFQHAPTPQAVLERGRRVALGKPLEVLTPQRLQKPFGVRAHYLTEPFDGAQILRFHL